MSATDPLTAGFGTRLFARYLLASGVSSDTIERTTGFNLRWMEDPDARFPMRIAKKLVDYAYHVSGDPALALRLFDPHQPQPLALVGTLVVNSDNILEGLTSWSKYIALDTDNIEIIVSEDGGYTLVEGRNYSNIRKPWVTELFLSLTMYYLHRLGSPTLKPVRCEFDHHLPDHLNAYVKLAGDRLLFDQPVARFTFDTEALLAPNPNANRYLRQALLRKADERLQEAASRHFSSLVERDLRKHLHTGNVTIEKISQHFDLSPASFRRRLSREGQSFASILERVRKELAIVYLEYGCSVAETSTLLGYERATSFQHAFRRWHGTSPLKYRVPT